MLNKLFGSNTRVKILKLFFVHPEGRFYIREIARKIREQVNSARRELINLEKFGILISEEEGKGQEKKYYRANTDFVLFEEIKSLFIKAQILYGKDFINKISNIGRVKLLILSGIFVNREDCPVDILIVGKVNREKLGRLIKELEKELGKEVNFSLMDYKEFDYRRRITDVFLYNILEGEKIVAIDALEAAR